MRLSTQIKPISYVKANAAEIIAELNDGGPPLVISQNGEAKAVLQGVAEYERTQETLALLKILALGEREIAEGIFGRRERSSRSCDRSTSRSDRQAAM